MQKLQQISESERILMRIIWEKEGVAMFADIMEQQERQGYSMRRNTVLTLLSRLIEKGYLKTGKIGRRNEYQAIVGQEDYNAAQTKAFLDKVYEGSVAEMVSTLLHHGLVSEEEREALRKFWKDGEGNE